jgi:hypothetical protein
MGYNRNFAMIGHHFPDGVATASRLLAPSISHIVFAGEFIWDPDYDDGQFRPDKKTRVPILILILLFRE